MTGCCAFLVRPAEALGELDLVGVLRGRPFTHRAAASCPRPRWRGQHGQRGDARPRRYRGPSRAHNHGGTLDAGAHSHGGTQNAGAHSHTGTTAGAGGHAHGAATGADGGHNHSGTTASNGSHNHSGTTSADGVHTHNWRSRSNAGSDAYGPIADIDRSISSGTTSDTDFLLNNTGLLNAGNHTHTFTTSTQAAHTHTFTTNTVANHTHTIESVGNHTHTFTTSSEPGHAHDIPTAPAHSHNITADGEHTHAITVQNAGSHNHTFSIPVQGAGALHSHGLSYTAGWRPRYVDVLICEKD